MFKDFLHNSIVKDLRVLKRLSGKIPLDQMSYRPKEGIRSTEELLQYLSFAGTAMPKFWLHNPQQTDFRTFFGNLVAHSKTLANNNYPAVFEKQIEITNELFGKIKEDDLLHMEVPHPSGATFKLGDGILETSIKWLAAYKMQLFLYIKLTTDHQLGTPDLWRKYED